MSDELLPSRQESLPPHDMRSGRALMAPVKFATACAACHLLTFDKHFDEGVPHDKPDVVHAFLIAKFTQYIAAHPGDVRVVRDPNRDLTERVPPQPEVRILTPAQWVASAPRMRSNCYGAKRASSAIHFRWAELRSSQR